jgi:two-component system, NarL family, response regulator NreC
MNRIRLLLADDHETVREALRMLLESRADVEVVAEAPDGHLAIERTKVFKPDVAVVDLSMPHMGGIAATRAIRKEVPATAVVVLSRHSEDAYVQELLSAGACGYVLKQSSFEELLKAIHSAARGERYLDSALVSRATDAYMSRYSQPAARPPITDREANVLRLMAIGHSNKEIASELGIAVKTVEVHKANAMRKLDLRGRIDVVRFAVLSGWLQDP